MENIYSRAVTLAHHIIKTGDTVRKTALLYGISKSTVHKDVTYRLATENYALYEEVKKILDHNFSQRHLRGGEATRKKYFSISNQ
jgi:putative DeoR family transcriptional regulator (stage III sporulation protein D)